MFDVKKYQEIAMAYESDPRWNEAERVSNDPEASNEEVEWAIQRMAVIERSFRRDEERLRISP